MSWMQLAKLNTQLHNVHQTLLQSSTATFLDILQKNPKSSEWTLPQSRWLGSWIFASPCGAAKQQQQQPWFCPNKKYCTTTSDNCAWSCGRAANSWWPSLLGLLAKIDHAFVGWAAQLIMWGAPKKNLQKCSVNGKQCILLLVLTLVLSWLVDWMIELSISNKEQTRHIGYFTLYSFNTPSGASVAVEDPYAATTAWHLLLMLVTNLVTRCCGMAFHSSTRIHCRSASVVVLVTLTRILSLENCSTAYQYSTQWVQ